MFTEQDPNYRIKGSRILYRFSAYIIVGKNCGKISVYSIKQSQRFSGGSRPIPELFYDDRDPRF
jgi:hypothetical protein